MITYTNTQIAIVCIVLTAVFCFLIAAAYVLNLKNNHLEELENEREHKKSLQQLIQIQHKHLTIQQRELIKKEIINTKTTNTNGKN